MSVEDIVRAWREPEFRQSFDAGDLPAHPAGPAIAADWNAGFDESIGFTAKITCTGTSKTAAKCCC